MHAEQIHPYSVREQVRGGRFIWAEWQYGEALDRLRKMRGVADHLNYYAIEFRSIAGLMAWAALNEEMDDLDNPDWDREDVVDAAFNALPDRGEWHEFPTWDAAVAWLERAS